jgi:magnesium and cobalt exporter, CNNM family
MTPLLLFLLLSAAIYIGTVTAAFSALMRLSLRIMAERSERGDDLGPYLEDPRRLFVPARILLSAINILAAALFARVVGVDPKGFPVLVLSIFGAGLACEHLVPLLIVRKDPERVLDVLLPSFNAVARVLGPLTSALLRMGTTARPDRNMGANGTEAPPSSTPVTVEPEPPGTDTLPEGQAREMLRTLVDFRETMVREVSTPRPDIIAIEADATIGQLRALFREQQYSRIPVFKDTIDNIQGFVFVKDLITMKSDAQPTDSIAPLLRPAYFVPETKKVPELLTEFQRNRIQSAIVVDEYGSTAGLVTIEDLLEEIVGEIRDEYDVEADKVVEEGDGHFVFSGITHIEEMGLHLKVHVEPRGFETVGGYLMSHLGRVPTVGERFELDGLEVEVLEAERRRVTRVRIHKREPVPAEEGTPDR